MSEKHSFLIRAAEHQVQQLWCDGATDIKKTDYGFTFKLRARTGSVDWWGKITWND